eukprot:TRINITY_DN7565_c0_g1_i1.p3 TRINITY_DN7565_c0_g1~~TRINITY_DN7565_c0_g1_i1.p3  ORF type:complete len:141 (-),score=25.91 TRINITY_DN7565_c0_g1_i1:113-535(-)
MEALNTLVSQYQGKPFSVLGFACNQFDYQTPGNSQEIYNSFHYVRPGNGYVPLFPIFTTIAVNGQKEDPFYRYMKETCPSSGVDGLPDAADISWSPVSRFDIAWNFEKFLFTKTGTLFKRYSPAINPVDIAADIDTLIAQ